MPEIVIPIVQNQPPSLWQRWRRATLFSFWPLLFWLLEFLAQYFWLSRGDIQSSLLRSFALAGATLIGVALFSSLLFKWQPRWGKYWRYRRYLGDWGFLFVLCHALGVYYFFFGFDLRRVYYSFQPFENPIVFGTIALAILSAMALTSTDWAVHKMKRWWKFLHRFVYLAYGVAILHFLLINPYLLKNPPGYLLLTVTLLTVLGQIYWFFRTVAKKRFRTPATLVGLVLIIGFCVMLYIAWDVYL